jgi:adenylylsulfate kinase-like enzyme
MNPTDLAAPISLPAGLHWGSTRLDPATLWITGPFRAEVLTVGRAVCSALTSVGRRVTLLEDEPGDLTCVDHAEQARRAAGAAATLVDDGVIAIVVIDSPGVRDRELARLAHEARDLPFFEIFVDTSTEARTVRPPAEVYEVPPLPDLVVFPGPVVAAVASVIALV